MSIGLGLPMFIRGMAETIKAKIKHFGRDDIEPGDILLTNDAYITGSHLNHLTFTLPIFHDGELVAFACCMAHWLESAARSAASPPTSIPKACRSRSSSIASAGVVNQDLVDIIRMNVRMPERAMGDLRAQITAVKTGERRFLELVERYGRDAVLGAIAAIMDQTEAAARARTRAHPRRRLRGRILHGRRRRRRRQARSDPRARSSVAGDEMTIDLTDVAEQVRGLLQFRRHHRPSPARRSRSNA